MVGHRMIRKDANDAAMLMVMQADKGEEGPLLKGTLPAVG